MRDTIRTEHYKGFDIEFAYDHDASSPDYWGNTDVFLVYDHRQFSVERKGFDPSDIMEHVRETKRWFYDGYFVFPLYAYIHSGVSLSLGSSGYPFNDRWDTSMAGFILVKRQTGWTYTKAKAEKVANSHVEEWNTYLSGDVFGYDWEHGGCWGFYNTDSIPEVLKDVKLEIDQYISDKIQKKVKAHIPKVKSWIKNRVPLIYREPVSV